MTRLRRIMAAFLLATPVVASFAHAQNGTTPATAYNATLKPGDIIKLWVYQQKDMTGEFPVPITGVVVFPKIGPRQVVGISKPTLRDSLIAAYGEYLRTPSIDIVFLLRISIVGEVRDPGLYHVDDTHSVSDALALAGGVTTQGRPDEVQLFRGSDKLEGSITRRTRIAELPLQSGDQLFVPERSWFERNTIIMASLVSGVMGLAVAFVLKN